MCGIAGWIDWERDLTERRRIVEAMGQTLVCRGPDAEGSWISPRAAFAHRRLIVVDPAGGGQPMVRTRGGHAFVIAYNGELYNTNELRSELVADGYVFRGHSDTEVLLSAFMAWGPACAQRLNGIFAFAIWDEAEQRLFAARDRLGVKPFFFAERGRGLLFGSELKALLAHPEVEPAIDKEGLAEIFAIGPARTPGHGVFIGVHELKPGYSLHYSRGGLQVQPYWRLVSAPHEESLEATITGVRDRFQDAVTRQLVSDVPVCTLLSGGLDSSAITACAAAAYRASELGPLDTFSVDYEGNDRHFKANEFQPDADEPWIRRMSEHLQSVHHRIVIDTPQLFGALLPAMRARDLPGMADIDSSLLLFCGAIKREATVALSGECADEIFGGYPWFHRTESLEATTFPWALRQAERERVLSRSLLAEIRLEEYVAARYAEALAEVPRLAGESGLERRIREIFYLTLTRWMPVLLDRKDRMSMAVGLEVRVPFCDHRLVEYVWNIPWAFKCVDGQRKGIFRRAMAGVLPPDVLNRPKSPYPKTHNPNYLRLTRRAVLEVLDDPASPLLPLVDAAEVRRLAQSDGDFDIPWFGQLMRLPQLFAYLVQVDAWLREYHVVIR
ncbi:MAG TPA: asparagine synthase (glutamine-hydrolyzing) [Limnochordia bacterium]|nr:asparagine synthase (glutamine-hydrolyzing) [Limnochordia bacterium]